MEPKILDVEKAAKLLDIHPGTLKKMCRAGDIPAMKVGREWRFIDVDLIEYMRSQYAPKKPDDTDEQCHSTNAKIRPIGGLKSSKTDSQYLEALGLQTAKKPKNFTIN